MNRLEEIQEIIKNFIYEKQQTKQQIAEIEQERTQLAQKRNERKSLNGNIDNAYANTVETEICELGKQISNLGNQSQELQSKLDSRFIEVRKTVNLMIDNSVSEGIRKIRKIEEQKEDLEEKISIKQKRNEKYETQKQEFFARFGRMPELSENAKKENEIQEVECEAIKDEIANLTNQTQYAEDEIAELAKIKRNFKNGNWISIIEECENVETEETVEELNTIQQEQIVENNDTVGEDHDELAEQISKLYFEEEIENQENNKNENSFEEDTITLPLVETEFAEDQDVAEIQLEKIQPIEEVELEEINVSETQPIEEIKVEEIEPIQEIKVEEIEPIQEIEVEKMAPIEELAVEEITIEEIESEENIKIEETNAEKVEVLEDNYIQEVKNIQQEENQDETQINEIEQITRETIQEIEQEGDNINETKEENEIITLEESQEEEQVIPTFGEKVSLIDIIVKIENGQVVYKAQVSNGEIIKIYPQKAQTGNLILKDKENREEIKEILINYAIAEYRTLDKKVIRKIDPIICEVLVKFAKKYNYDAQNLIYNYAMSFSKSEEVEIDSIPTITYNLAYLEGTELEKREKDILTKICKNARKNEKIDIIGCNTGISKIRYILKRTFGVNNANALPEGKY